MFNQCRFRYGKGSIRSNNIVSLVVFSEEVEEVEEEIGGFTVENAFAEEDDEDDNTPDFLKPKHSGNKSKFEKLEFGNNTHNGNNKNKKRR